MGLLNFPKSAVFNLPNQLTLLRFFLAIIFFIVLSYHFYVFAFIAFFLAVLTDWLDGYIARKKGLLTDFGRLADPFVDKIIICGGFILLVQHTQGIIPAWMVVVIVSREFLVNSIRSYSESKGIEFGATIFGKAKMLIQSVTISSILIFSAYFKDFVLIKQGVIIMVWITVIITVFSGIKYTIKAGPTILES